MRARLLTALLLCLACACSRPSVSETFIRAEDAVNGLYSFEFEIADSLASYDFAFYTRVDGAPSEIRLDVEWFSPRGEVFSETVFLQPVGIRGDVQDYRCGVRTSHVGLWKMNVNIRDVPVGFRGLGLVCRTNSPRSSS